MNRDAQLMQEAANEIRQLRQIIAVQNGQLDIVRLFQAALLGPPNQGPQAADIAHFLLQRSAELAKAETVTPPPPAS